jgi:hypothetical protein
MTNRSVLTQRLHQATSVRDLKLLLYEALSY